MDLRHLLQFETLIEHLDAQSIINICKTSREYREVCNDREVWVTLYKKRFGANPTYDPRQEYIERIRYKLNVEYPIEIIEQEDGKYRFPSFVGEYAAILYRDGKVYMIKIDIEGMKDLFMKTSYWSKQKGRISDGIFDNDNLILNFVNHDVYEMIWRPEFEPLTQPWINAINRANTDIGSHFGNPGVIEYPQIKYLGYNILREIFSQTNGFIGWFSGGVAIIFAIFLLSEWSFIEPDDWKYMDIEYVEVYNKIKDKMRQIYTVRSNTASESVIMDRLPETYEKAFGETIEPPAVRHSYLSSRTNRLD